MVRKTLLLVAGTFLLFSCNKDSTTANRNDTNPPQKAIILTAEEAERLPLFETEIFRTEEEILASAIGFMRNVDSESPALTRSSVSHKAVISGVIDVPLTLPQASRALSPGEESRVYVVNFGQDAGYILISADKRVATPVLAFSDSGSFELNPDDLVSRIIVGQTQGYVADEIGRIEAMREDSVCLSLQARYGFGNAGQEAALSRASYAPDPEYPVTDGLPGSSPNNPYGTKQGSNWQVVTNGIAWYWAPVDRIINAEHHTTQDLITLTYPLLQTKWGQSWPYNVTVIEWKHPYTVSGCAPTAIAQIMNYHRKPSRYLWDQFGVSNETFLPYELSELAWERKSEAVIQNIGQLMYDIGDAVRTSYFTGTASTFPENLILAFPVMGYASSALHDFSEEEVTTELKSNRPVLIGGDDTYEPHVWVIDGLSQMCNYNLQYQNCYYQGNYVGHITTYTVNYTADTKYFHLNFGWSGQYDGWFIPGYFKSKHGYYEKLKIVTRIQ